MDFGPRLIQKVSPKGLDFKDLDIPAPRGIDKR